MKIFLTTFLMLFSLLGKGHSKLLITDFVFLNNIDSQHEAIIPNFFEEYPEKLEGIKSLVILVLEEKYDSTQVSFHEKSIWFHGDQNPSSAELSALYRNNHKKLVKVGEYDYYLRFYADVSTVSTSHKQVTHAFSLRVRISDKKGKKTFRNVLKGFFSSRFHTDQINSAGLISMDNFFAFFTENIPLVFQDQRVKTERKTLL